MNAFWQSPIAVLAVLSFLSVPPRTFGDAAMRETLRRQLTARSKVTLTNLGQPLEIPLTPPVVAPPAGEAPPAGPPPAEPVKDEKWWRNRMAAAHERLSRDVAAAAALQARVSVLQHEVVAASDPLRETQLRQELQKTLEELNKTRQLIGDDQKAIQDIQDEARRVGVPPGWIRILAP